MFLRQWSRQLSLILVSLLLLCCTAFAAPEWKPIIFMDNEIYPSYQIAIANLGRNDATESNVLGYKDGTVGVYVKAPAPNSKVKLTLQIEDAADKQGFEFTLPRQGEIYLLLPYVKWNWKQLRNSRQSRASNASFTIIVNGSQPDTFNQVVTVRSINDALLGFESQYPGAKKEWVPTNFVLASYVNEDHPWIDGLLREALDSGIVNQFDGYQSGNTNAVLNQVFAIWYTLQRRGFRYSSITKTSGSNSKGFSQHVRLFQDSITSAQANCVDGTVMMASILRKIGIDSGVVTIPGHCFLVFRLSPKAEQSGLETTMVGDLDLRKYPPAGPKDPAREASLKNFIKAVTVGSDEFSKNIGKITKSKEPAYSLTMIGDARKLFKIYPLVLDQ